MDVLETDLKNEAFGVERSIRYHDCRADFLRRCSRLCSLVSTVAGAGSFIAILKQVPTSLQLFLPGLVTAVSLFNTIFDLRGSSDLHRKLSSRFSQLLHDIELTPKVTKESVALLRKRRREIENDAPAALRILDVCCHNDLIRSKNFDPDEFYDLCWWQKFPKHVASLGTIPKKRGHNNGRPSGEREA